MIRPRHFLVPLLLAALAFAVGQVLPGMGIFVAMGCSFVWIEVERRGAGNIPSLACNPLKD